MLVGGIANREYEKKECPAILAGHSLWLKPRLLGRPGSMAGQFIPGAVCLRVSSVEPFPVVQL
ncbi:MAG TPA: hypothetical protein DCE47_05785 [Planctomycetaceae bacterium]|nr:hypothetical protein [Planctomycetaceae bacterium]HCD02470.1 hypothetical protein [Planctomycetaceae bacterium]